jgi:hypothetical protein
VISGHSKPLLANLLADQTSSSNQPAPFILLPTSSFPTATDPDLQEESDSEGQGESEEKGSEQMKQMVLHIPGSASESNADFRSSAKLPQSNMDLYNQFLEESECVGEKGISIRDTRATLARNEAIVLREMQMEDLVFFQRLGIKQRDLRTKQRDMFVELAVVPEKKKLEAREDLLRNSLSFDYKNKVDGKMDDATALNR